MAFKDWRCYLPFAGGKYRDDDLECKIYALQERCDELEARVSYLEDEYNLDRRERMVNPEDEIGMAGWEGKIEEDDPLFRLPSRYEDCPDPPVKGGMTDADVE